MAGLSLGTAIGMNNVLIPRGGPKCVPALLDFSNAAEIEIDGQLIVMQQEIEYLQGVFIDNADNADTLTLTMNTTGHRIVCPPNSQGFFAMLVPNPPRIIAETTQGASQQFNVFFYNVPIQSMVWSVV
jgi:hypothetical protein